MRFFSLTKGLILSGLMSGALFAAESLTISDSLERANKNNPRLLIAMKDLSIAKTQVRQAQSLYYPKVNLNLDYIRYRNETVGITSPELGNVILEAPIAANKSEQRGNPLAQNLYLGRVGFIQTLYAGGKVTATNRLSQAGLRHAEISVDTVRHQVECETKEHFYRLLALKEEQKVLSSTLIEIEKLSKQSTSTYVQFRLSAAQSEIRRRLSDLKQEEGTVKFQYLQAMGLELFSDIEAAGNLAVSESIPDLQTLLVWAKENRAELKETQVQEELDHLAVELSRSERYPVFLLGGGVELRNDEFPLKETNWNTALSMTIPIFDGFSGYARVKESRYRADQGRMKRVQLEDQVEMEVRAAHGTWIHWKNEVSARANQMNMLDQMRRKNFQESEKLDFLKWHVDSNVSWIESRYELCVAEARLTKAIGRPLSK